MTSVLRGNFKTKKDVKVKQETADDLETRFEREAMKRLGGSIAFVRKKQVLWGDDKKDGDGN